MKKGSTAKRIKRIAIIILIIAVLALDIYIMKNNLGLIEELDFGAGAYYYADIPQFAKYVDAEHFISSFPLWVHIVLFLLWGGLMYKLWSWLEKKL